MSRYYATQRFLKQGGGGASTQAPDSGANRLRQHALRNSAWILGGLTHHDAITGTCTAKTAFDYSESIKAYNRLLSVSFESTFVIGMLTRDRFLPLTHFRELPKRDDAADAVLSYDSANPVEKELPLSGLIDLDTLPLDLDRLLPVSRMFGERFLIRVVKMESADYVLLRVATVDHVRLGLVLHSGESTMVHPRVAFCGGGMLVTLSCIYEFRLLIPPDGQNYQLQRLKPNQASQSEQTFRKVLDELPTLYDKKYCFKNGVCWKVAVEQLGLQIQLMEKGKIVGFRLGFRRYKYTTGGTDGTHGGSSSGPYVFDPPYASDSFRIQEFHEIEAHDSVFIFAGVIDRNNYFRGMTYVMQIHLKASHLNRLEVRYFVQNPNPTRSSLTMELTTQYTFEGAQNPNEEFYTDSNGMEFVLRKRMRSFDRYSSSEYRQAYGSQKDLGLNYYPVTSGIKLTSKIEGQDKHDQMIVMVDRPHAGTLLNEDTLELMVMRINPFSDGKGVDEPVMDEGNYDVQHTIFFGEAALQQFRKAQMRNTQKPIAFGMLTESDSNISAKEDQNSADSIRHAEDTLKYQLSDLLETALVKMHNNTHIGITLINSTEEKIPLSGLSTSIVENLGVQISATQRCSIDFFSCTPDPEPLTTYDSQILEPFTALSLILKANERIN